jgi:hypothetical protein
MFCPRTAGAPRSCYCTHTQRPGQGKLFTQLLQRRLQALENLARLLVVHAAHVEGWAYLELDLGLRNVRLAAVAAGDFLRLGDLVPDGLCA